jgi:hypothetical protein
VLLHVSLSGAAQLHANKLESLLFEPSDNLSNKASLNGIRLKHNEGTLLIRFGYDLHFFFHGSSGGYSSSVISGTSLFDILNLGKQYTGFLE